MLKVGVTGGIGSGKSVVCQVFHALGIPVFNADDAARHLMENDASLVNKIQTLLGDEVYINRVLDRAKVSAIIFGKPEMLKALNALVHPATITYSQNWIMNQSAAYVIKEAAIFFESESNKEMDVMIGVSAPEELRIHRAMKRGALSSKQVSAIIAKQMSEDEKMSRCDFVIINDDGQAVLPQVLKIHAVLLKKSGAINT
jgi:dephospho-CoA kinase